MNDKRLLSDAELDAVLARLPEMEERERRAAKPPWRLHLIPGQLTQQPIPGLAEISGPRMNCLRQYVIEDAEFVVESRSDLPDLIAALRTMQARCDAAEQLWADVGQHIDRAAIGYNHPQIAGVFAENRALRAKFANMENQRDAARLDRDTWRDAETRTSNAYLRLRTKLDGFDTPHAPTPEQVWAHTEARLDAVIRERDALRARVIALSEPPRNSEEP